MLVWRTFGTPGEDEKVEISDVSLEQRLHVTVQAGHSHKSFKQKRFRTRAFLSFKRVQVSPMAINEWGYYLTAGGGGGGLSGWGVKQICEDGGWGWGWGAHNVRAFREKSLKGRRFQS